MEQSEVEIFLIPEAASLPFEGFDLVVGSLDHGAGDRVFTDDILLLGKTEIRVSFMERE
jgi:hypothetical protein